jgi:hypothetical protein
MGLEGFSMDRLFEFHPRAFSLCRAMRLVISGYSIFRPSHAYRTLRLGMWLAFVSASFSTQAIQ